MLTEEIIQQNKERFISLLRGIKREGANIEGLLYKLEHSDFFTAPASSMYHNAIKGGLVDHTLHVRDRLFMLVRSMYGEDSSWSEDTLNIVSLSHDFDKIDFYEPSVKNVKKYSPNGSKHDEMGNFDWHSEAGWKMREGSERFIYGSHGQNSEYIVGSYIPLAIEESVSIINHMGWEPTANMDLTGIYNRYSLAVLLHLADMLSTYIDEKLY